MPKTNQELSSRFKRKQTHGVKVILKLETNITAHGIGEE